MLPEIITPEMVAQKSAQAANYDGSNDDFIHVPGSSAGFLNESSEQNTYKFSVENGHATLAKTAELAAKQSLNGEDITITGISSDFEDFTENTKHNPTRVVGFKVESATAQVLTDLKLEVQRYVPSKGWVVEKNIYPANYRSAKDLNTGIINVPVGFQLDANVRVRTSLPKTSAVTVTYVLGASLSTASGLMSKALRAGRDI